MQVHGKQDNRTPSYGFAPADTLYSARLWTSVPLSDDKELEIGLNGIPEPVRPRIHKKIRLLCMASMPPLKNTFCPVTEDSSCKTNSSVFTGKWLARRSTAGDFTVLLTMRWSHYWDAGVRYDYVRSPWTDAELASSTSIPGTLGITGRTNQQISFVLTRSAGRSHAGKDRTV